LFYKIESLVVFPMVRPGRSDHWLTLLRSITAVQECDATGDAMKNFCRVHKKSYHRFRD